VSVRASFPSAASCAIATCVKTLLIEPMLNFVSARFGTPETAVGHARGLEQERLPVLRP
jgi:hypothetical protein